MAPGSPNGLALKLGYASGTLSFSVKDVAFGSFVLYYYTSVVGLKGSRAGLVLFIAMVWDALTDPIVGSISDNLRTRRGRRHPLAVFLAVPYQCARRLNTSRAGHARIRADLDVRESF
ncbi:MAG: MFS transporter [Pseudomonadales bacterium]